MELIDILVRLPKLDIVLVTAFLAVFIEYIAERSSYRAGSRPIGLVAGALALIAWQFHPYVTAGLDNAEKGYFLIYAALRSATCLVALGFFAMIAFFISRRSRSQ